MQIIKTPIQIITLLIASICWGSTALAATITVDASCSLVEAIQAANNDQTVGNCVAGSGSDVLNMAEANASIHVSQGMFPSVIQGGVMTAFPPITDELTIQGNGLHVIVDSSVHAFRVFEFFHTFNQRLTLENITITGADDGAGMGSALFTLGGNLTLVDCQFVNNHGAVLMLETLNALIDRTLFINNWAEQGDEFSPALELIGVSLTLSNSSLVNNQVLINDPLVDLSDSHPGGALSITSPLSGLIRIENNTISGNQAVTGGGVSIRDQHGLTVDNGSPAPVEFLFNTITDNSALHVGGVVIHAVNSNIRFNHNVIVGNHASQSEGREVWLADANDLIMAGHNVIADHVLNPIFASLISPEDLLTSQPTAELLGPLQGFGSILFHPLLAGSVAIDVGAEGCDVAHDQREQPRPIDGDNDGQAACDAGSIERQEIIFQNDFE